MLRVSVAFSPEPGAAEEVELTLPEGSTLLDALRAGGALGADPASVTVPARVGLWGALQPPETTLREGDRVELYRPLQVDPMQARRLRQRKQAAEREQAKRRGRSSPGVA